MKKLLGIVAMLVLIPGALGQESRAYTRPAVPSREALDRLHLKMAWRALIPVGDLRDGIFSVQMIDDQVVVQTREGFVASLNASNGTTTWRRQVGNRGRMSHQIGWNRDTLFVPRGRVLHAVSRRNGEEQWSFEMEGLIAATPGADDVNVYVSTGIGKMQVYELPKKKKVDEPVVKKEPVVEERVDRSTERGYNSYGKNLTSISGYTIRATAPRKTMPEPQYLWEYKTSARLEQAPILTDELLVLASNDGSFFVTSKHYRHVPYEFKTNKGLAAPLGHYALKNDDGQIEDFVYVAAQDNNLYSVDVNRGQLVWRFTGAAPIRQQPAVTDEDVYMVAENSGLYRIKRVTGQLVWRNTKADRFLSINKKFVYATDRSGRLLVLDRERGVERGSYDTSGFKVPVLNERTDRIFLANDNGLLICLYDRDYPTPLVTKTIPERKAPEKPAAEEKPVEKKPAEKKEGDGEKKGDKKEDKKDDKKDKEKEKDKDA
jgi:outer membrane protein assembly factor BamB